MKNIKSLLALALCTALSAPGFAATFSNNWSFVDQLSGETIGGLISGLENGEELNADGLVITVTQSPHAIFLGSYEAAVGPGWPVNSYTASNGVVTFASFMFSNEVGELLYFGTHPGNGSYWPEFRSDNDPSGYAYNQQAGMQFSAVTAAVPEPATWALMIGGLWLVGRSLRQRKTAVSFS